MDVYCPNCGYDLRDIPEQRCPECGFGYDHAGIKAVAGQRACDVLAAYRRAVFGSAFAAAIALVPLSAAWIGDPIIRFGMALGLLWTTEIARRVTGGERLRDWAAEPFQLIALALFQVLLSAVVLLLVWSICWWVGAAVAVYAWCVYLARPKDLPYSAFSHPEPFQHRLRRYRVAAGLGLVMATLLILCGWP
jgi:hypothetical protein